MKSGFSLIFVFVAVFTFTFLSVDIAIKNVINPLNEIVSTTHFETENNDYRYRISVFDGKLAVFDGNSKLPYKVYDTYISSLPEDDIAVLTEGIRVNTSKELMEIIEEYTS